MKLFPNQEERRKREMQQEIIDAGDFLLAKSTPEDIIELAYLAIDKEKAKCEVAKGEPEKLHVYNKLLEAQLAVYRKYVDVTGNTDNSKIEGEA